MSIAKKFQKIKSIFLKNEKDLFFILIIVIVSLLSFFLGRIYQLEASRAPIKLEWYDLPENERHLINNREIPVFLRNNGGVASNNEDSNTSVSVEKGIVVVVGSKSGNKYHYPWCPSAKTIKPENLIEFTSIEEARAAGYLPAGNCPGLE